MAEIPGARETEKRRVGEGGLDAGVEPAAEVVALLWGKGAPAAVFEHEDGAAVGEGESVDERRRYMVPAVEERQFSVDFEDAGAAIVIGDAVDEGLGLCRIAGDDPGDAENVCVRVCSQHVVEDGECFVDAIDREGSPIGICIGVRSRQPGGRASQ